MWILGLKRDETGFNIFNVACVQTQPPLSKKKKKKQTSSVHRLVSTNSVESKFMVMNVLALG